MNAKHKKRTMYYHTALFRKVIVVGVLCVMNPAVRSPDLGKLALYCSAVVGAGWGGELNQFQLTAKRRINDKNTDACELKAPRPNRLEV